MSDFISTPRLSTYENILKLTDPNQKLRAYYWNIALAGAIYPLMQTLEITLRNAIDVAVKNYHQPNSANGSNFVSYKNNDLWFEQLVKAIQDRKIAKMSKQNAVRWVKNGNRIKYSTTESHVKKARDDASIVKSWVKGEDVLSRLPFGFWTTLLGKDYEDLTNKHLLWPNLLPYVFPNAPSNIKRKDIEDHFNLIREFRNRLSHHEPIWKFYSRNPANNLLDYSTPIFGLNASLNLLNKQYDDMLMLLQWMSLSAYNNFNYSRIGNEFNKLCSIDGFYAYVDKEKVANCYPASKVKREFFKLAETLQNVSVVYMKTNGKRGYILGLNEPSLP